MSDGDMESGPQDAVESKADERGETEGRSGGEGTSQTVDSALTNPEAASAHAPDAPEARPKPDPVALLRDQLARLARGEAPTVVGGVDHIDTPHGDGAERARRRSALAAEAAALAAAETAAREENATNASSTNEESTALHSRPMRDVELPPTAHTEATTHNPSPTASTTDNTPTAAPNHAAESTALAPESAPNPPAAPPADNDQSAARNGTTESTALAASDAASASLSPAAVDGPGEAQGRLAESTALTSSDVAKAAMAAPVGDESGGTQTGRTESTALAASDAAGPPSPPAAGDGPGEAQGPLAESTALASSEIAGATPASLAGGESAEVQARHPESTALDNSAADRGESKPDVESSALADRNRSVVTSSPDPESTALEASSASEAISENESSAYADAIETGSVPSREAESTALAVSGSERDEFEPKIESSALDGRGGVSDAPESPAESSALHSAAPRPDSHFDRDRNSGPGLDPGVNPNPNPGSNPNPNPSSSSSLNPDSGSDPVSDSDFGSGPGLGPIFGPGSGPGADLGPGSDLGSGSGPGSDLGSGPGPGLGPDLSSDSSSAPGSDLRSDASHSHVSGSGSDFRSIAGHSPVPGGPGGPGSRSAGLGSGPDPRAHSQPDAMPDPKTESHALEQSGAGGAVPMPDSESGALGDSGTSESGGRPGRESGALSGERWQPGSGAEAHAGPASGGGTGGSSSRGDNIAGDGGWVGPGIGGAAKVVATEESAAGAATTAPPPLPDPARRPFAAVVADVARLLAASGAPERMAPQVATALGSEAAETLAADPWALLAVPGIAPQQADLFARGALGAGWIADDPRRVRAIVLWLLRRAARQGDTAIEADAARAALAHFEVGDPDTALRAILAEGRVMAFAAALAGLADADGDFDEIGEPADDFDADFDEGFEEPDELAAVGGVLLALDDYALAEEAIAEAVVRLMSTVEPWPETGDTKLDRALGTNGVLLYAAGPGEEPPAAVLTVAANARNAGLRVAVVAPTIDGRDRLGAGAVGLRELAAMERGPDGTLELDLLVVTDATLLDVTAAAAIFEAVPDGARILLAGDPAGLESTGPGRVFTDLAATGAIRALVAPTVPDDPPAALADGIRDGRLPPIQDPERRVVLIPAHSGEEAAHRCAQLVADSIPRAIGIAARDVLVVAPLATGPAGATALNAALKVRLNPGREIGPGAGSSAVSGDGVTGAIDVGDCVIRAMPDASGGVVQGIVREALPDGRVVVAFGTAAPEAVRRAELRHGWALTARQSLGIRRPAAVVVLPAEGADAYTRALMYTLVTRGERHVSIVHAAGPALAAAVAADPTRLRTTHLQQALREAAG
ncbi:helix-hairpin-helix domain-containing protein [Embleya sp. NPDC050154]|uniref:helix-hairpin-helix domain-containing protein n=1 Tax=Embleya sp. NPDC050154 TaxID=3363988 RepID=UPI0037BC9FB2